MILHESRLRKIITHTLLIAGLLLSIFPFYWMAVMATNTTSDIYSVPPKLIFGGNLWLNISHALQNMDFLTNFVNTLIIACTTTILVLFFCSIAGFTFAKFEFPGKNVLLTILLGTIILPSAGSIVALFVIMADLRWIGTLLPVIVPSMVTAFGIFWMRQTSLGAIPNELVEAARIDGANHLRQYWHVALPPLRPALGWLGIITFVAAWNEYYWPLIILNDSKLYTLQLGLILLNGNYGGTDYSMVMAATVLSVIPLFVVFFIGARQFISNISAGALKF